MAESAKEVQNGGIGRVFEDLWDRGLQVFDRAIDFEFADKQLDLIKEARAFEARNTLDTLTEERKIRGTAGFLNSVDNQTLVIAGGLVLAGIVAFVALR